MTRPSVPPTAADLRGRLAAAYDVAARSAPLGEWPTVTRLDDAPVPPGFAVWQVGGGGGPMTALPALVPDAPFEVRHRYLARVVANGTGRCPMCGEVENVSTIADPEHGQRAAYYIHPASISVLITHSPDCPAEFGEADRQWFDPRAVGS